MAKVTLFALAIGVLLASFLRARTLAFSERHCDTCSQRAHQFCSAAIGGQNQSRRL